MMLDFSLFLFKAIERGDHRAVVSMLDAGADVNATTLRYGQRRTALWVAALREQKEVCLALLDRGADPALHVNQDGREFPNMLYMTVWDTELTVRLIRQGLDPFAKGESGHTLLWWAEYARNSTLQNILIQLHVRRGKQVIKQY